MKWAVDASVESGRHALEHLLDRRQVIKRLGRVLLALAISLTVATLAQHWWIEPNLSSRTSLWLSPVVAGVLALACVLFVTGIPLRREISRARTLVASHELEFEERSASQTFLRDVADSFDMAEREEELYGAAAIALAEASPGQSELLVADASNAHLTRIVVALDREPPACGAVTPGTCPAVRRGKTMLFGDPNGLSACPKLRERNLPASAVAACVPINVLGAPTAVLHSICLEPLDQVGLTSAVRRLEGVAARFGSRLGLLRATARSRLQGELDPLTGLLNRRMLENSARELLSAQTPLAMAMLDLDHFKVLNDTYGHATGDRALRLFSRVLKEVLRETDVVARHGGEEFVVLLPHSDVTTAAPVLHRIRDQLRAELASAEVPPFTCSIGLVDSTVIDDYFALLRAADQALLSAKSGGRDRLVISDVLDDPSSVDVTV
jgi:diguanylate cyclase (GGDEF)-like protein